jgi:hypothetical protein
MAILHVRSQQCGPSISLWAHDTWQFYKSGHSNAGHAWKEKKPIIFPTSGAANHSQAATDIICKLNIFGFNMINYDNFVIYVKLFDT